MMGPLRALLAFALLAGLDGRAAAQDARSGVAVLPFENGGSYGQEQEDFDALRVGLAAMVASELGRHPAARLIERDRMRALLEEQDLAGAERIDAATAAGLGRTAGARYVIAGTFIDLYGDFRVDARIIDVETREIVKVVRSDPKLTDRTQMFRIVQSVAERVAEAISLPPPPGQGGRARNIPTQALTLYSRGLLAQDRGQTERAIDYYTRAIGAFPDYTEAREGLRRLRGG